ncbi:inositol monophosphatase family protein [Marinomonas piezotolerans]|uniref:inositol monophosphatase family protein n=1 Tax=Marinomonas piezotolerans TaxID=2213058 RepID=UPI001314E478|nr:inositol monophosphatase [Marinomonas piezotolerans]
MISKHQKDGVIDIVRRVAADEILPRFRALQQVDVATKSGFDDLVTEADLAAEKAMTQAFIELLPGVKVIGEEAVADRPEVLDQIDQDGLVVIIDPIDGTWNYANGLSTFGVLVAVVFKGQTIFGLQYDPVNDDWIEASVGEGCFYVRADRSPLRIRLDERVMDSRLVGMFSPFQFQDLAVRQGVAMLQAGYARVLSLRCCCHEYRTLSQGGVDFYLSPKPRVWDHAAGILCYQEAGGVVQMLDGREYRPTIREGVIVAARSVSVLNRVRDDFLTVLDA